MTTHGENIGSHKVEPETQNQPLWRLKANYLMRQLARIWYGKLSQRDYPNSAEFERLFLEIMCQFVEAHGGNRNEVLNVINRQREEFEAVHGRKIRFKDRVREFWWMVRNGIPKELYNTFADDEMIQSIFWTAEWLLDYEEEEKEPPYEPAPWMKPLDYYEQLPVLEPAPAWRLLANGLLRDLAHVWYGKINGLPKDFHERLRQLVMAFAIEKGNNRREAQERIWDAEGDFMEIHGCELTFTTPVQEVIWVSKVGLAEPQGAEFLNDPQVKFILTAAELIYALSKVDLKPPYEKYSISFGPLEGYEKLPVSNDAQTP
jgi:hypothetical protein